MADQCLTSKLQGTRLLPGKVCQEGKTTVYTDLVITNLMSNLTKPQRRKKREE